MLMHERQHDDLVLFDQEEERVRKAAQHRSPEVTLHALVQLRVSPKMRLRQLEVVGERCRLIDLGLRGPRNGILDFCSRRGALVTDRIAH
jgi:hypothetical protein